MATYIPDTTFNTKAKNGFFRSPNFAKSYTFYLKNPRNEDEKKVKIVIYNVDLSEALKNGISSEDAK